MKYNFIFNPFLGGMVAVMLLAAGFAFAAGQQEAEDGANFEKDNVIPSTVVTSNNVDQYMDNA